MLHFVAGVYNNLFRTPEYHVLIVGRECAGKSTLLEQLKFLYTPTTQREEEEQLQADRRAAAASPPAQSPSRQHQAGEGEEEIETEATATDTPLSSSSATTASRRPSLPPGTPLPATAAYMAQKRIRPTVGLNYAVVQHRFSPPVAVLARVKKSALRTAPVASLPPLPTEIVAEQKAKQQALLANAPSDGVTRVVLRDLGGQNALRDLWDKYYSQTQALVYVVDSTLPFRMSASSGKAVQAPPLPAEPPRDHFTKQELADLYAPDRQLLVRLLQHPLLTDVPVLLLCNKVDEASHIPLASVQEAMELAELAASRAFYLHGGKAERETSAADEEYASNGTHGDASLALSAERRAVFSRHCAQAEAAQRRVGESGFGEIAMRIAEVSAVTGAGVAGAMDWLVAQLLYRARNVGADA